MQPISRLAECITRDEKTSPHSRACGRRQFLRRLTLNPNEPKETGETERLNQRLVYRAIKTAIDPDHTMNPGKILQV
jgi:hypothetical protein